MTPEPMPDTPDDRLPSGAQPVVQMAKEDLARRLGIGAEGIKVVSVKALEWPDASLGCPQPGMMYAQVITPGFLIVLEAAGHSYEDHSDRTDRVVPCRTSTSQ